MQVNVLGAERRRRWSYDEKVRLVEETLQAGETVCGVARRHGVAHSLLFTWRRQARQGRLGGDAAPALFSHAVTRARAARITALEAKLLRARRGAETSAAVFALKNADPMEWRDVRSVDHQHSMKVEQLTDAQLYAIAAGKAGGNGTVIEGEVVSSDTR
jgi:transposase